MSEEIPLAEYLKTNLPKQKSYVYSMLVGGEEYIGFTSQLPKKRLEQHIQSAKEGSTQKVHMMLRKFGYLNDFEIISSHDNEILALVKEISEIKRRKSTLNTSHGGEGNKIELCERTNEFGEPVFFVIDKFEREKRVIAEEANENKKQLELERKQLELEHYRSKFEEWHDLKKNNPENLPKDFYRYLEDKYENSTTKAIFFQNDYQPKIHKEIITTFDKLFSCVINSDKRNAIFREIEDLNKEISEIQKKVMLGITKWEKNNPPSLLEKFRQFDKQWMNPFPRVTSYEKRQKLAHEKVISENRDEINKLKQKRSLRLTLREGNPRYEI